MARYRVHILRNGKSVKSVDFQSKRSADIYCKGLNDAGKKTRVIKVSGSRKYYEFTYFGVKNPEEDQTWRSTSLTRLKKIRKEIVGEIWGDNPEAVPIDVRSNTGKLLYVIPGKGEL